MLRFLHKSLNVMLMSTLVLTTGCSVGPHHFEPPTELPADFSDAGQARLISRWWLSFDDPGLNQLVNIALGKNLNLRATFNKLQQSIALAAEAGSPLIPAINGNFNRLTTTLANTQNSITSNYAGFSASYEIDLWGRIRSGALASVMDAQASALDVQTAAITLSAEIANTWYQLVAQQLTLDLLNQQIKTNTENVDLVESLFKGGQATIADLFQQRQLLESVIGKKYTVIANIEVLKNQLAVLTGRAPGTISVDDSIRLPDLPPLPDTGLTGDLIQRRPDIKSAYKSLQAADLRVASAVANRLPKLSLSGSMNTTTPDLRGFFNNWLGTLAGNLMLPLVDGGYRVAEIQRNKALTKAALNNYGQTILQSLQEVENALIQEKQQFKLLNNLKNQLQLLNNAYGQIKMRYIYGTMTFLRVLSALTNLQSLQRSIILAKQELITYRINLYRSLAGGLGFTHPAYYE